MLRLILNETETFRTHQQNSGKVFGGTAFNGRPTFRPIHFGPTCFRPILTYPNLIGLDEKL